MRREAERLQDILDAIVAIERYTSQGRKVCYLLLVTRYLYSLTSNQQPTTDNNESTRTHDQNGRRRTH